MCIMQFYCSFFDRTTFLVKFTVHVFLGVILMGLSALCARGADRFTMENRGHDIVPGQVSSGAGASDALPQGRYVAPDSLRWHVKTNLAGWAMMVGNVALEVDFERRWSFALPVYYSAMNYFTRTVKFRTLTFQPELRYWIGVPGIKRWFVGIHMGLGWFNYAVGGRCRIQDMGGHSPALGGGLGGGYRLDLPWGSHNRWQMEFTIGVGVYDVRYDKWLNRAGGTLVDGRIHRTFIGVDQAAVSIIYSFH